MVARKLRAQKGAVEFALPQALIYKASEKPLPEKHYSRKRGSVPTAQQMLGSVMGVQAPPRTLALRICDSLRLPACRLGNSPASELACIARLCRSKTWNE